MDFIKKHYEKIVLGLVLLGLFGAVIALPIIKGTEDQKMKDILTGQVTRKVQPLPPLDLSTQELVLQRVATPPVLNFGAPNKLFNPMPWQRAADGHLILADSTNVGPRAVQITKTTPLYLIISNQSISVSDSGTHYIFNITKQNAAKAGDRSTSVSALGVGAKNNTFELRAVVGPTNDPTTLILRLLDTDTDVKLTRDKAYQRIDGFMADLKYPPENRTWSNERVGATLHLNGEDYKIVSISENEVVLQAPNQKKWTIKYSGASASPLSTSLTHTPPP